MIIKDIKLYDGSLIHKRFAYKYFRNHTLPSGNIIAFRAPMDVSISNMIDQEDVLQNDTIISDDAVNFCWEIPDMCPRGAVAFQRHFNSNIGHILSTKYIKKSIMVKGDDLMVMDKFLGSDNIERDSGKASVSITFSRNNVAIGHTGINVSAGRKAPPFAYSTKMSDQDCEDFMQDILNIFYVTADEIFLASSKVDF